MLQRVLVIDDEESIRFTLSAFLQGDGYQVETAADFAEAVAHLEGDDFDLILADILLGPKTGIDLLREARRREMLTPVVMITGSPELATATEALRLGACDYIAKPVTRDVVLEVTRKVLTRRRVDLERERLRQHLEAVFRSSEEGIVTVDGAGRIMTMNLAAEDLCGMTANELGEWLTGPAVGDLPPFAEALRTVLLERHPCLKERLQWETGGRRRSLTLRAAPLSGSDGRAIGGMLLVREERAQVAKPLPSRERSGYGRLVGRSLRMQEVYSLIDVLAEVDSTVLISGESGTGKELVAEALHQASARRNRPLVKVNCAALAEGLLESELFGHVRGAFTGATADKIGRFQRAHGGTIFLDEIGDISPALQVRLLRVLQQKEFERVGDVTPQKVDVRILAATHQDLLQKVRQGEFREDLYYRLKVVNIDLPPLRRRKEDIPLLLEHLLHQFNERFGRFISGCEDDVCLTLLQHEWPGNVRELEHAIEHAFVLCRGDRIAVEHLPIELRPALSKPRSFRREVVDQAATISEAIDRCGGNKAKAARLLGVSRQTLYRKLSELGLDPESLS